MGHELTNLFILAGSLFLLFIGYLAYQLASTEKGTRNLLLFFVICILIFIFSIHFLMYRFENASATMGDKNYRCKWYFAIISFNS